MTQPTLFPTARKPILSNDRPAPNKAMPPPRQGLYDPAYEHDACGVAFVARLDAVPSHETVQRALQALANLEHRGAEGADANTGDGAGITVQIPDAFFRAAVDELPPSGAYGIGVCFLPHDDARRAELEQLVETTIAAEGQQLLMWRDVPVDERRIGETARAYKPVIRQVVIAAAPGLDQDAFERKLYVIRRIAELAAGADLVVPSFSSRTLVYKGMLSAPQLEGFYPDLADPLFKSALALVHSRYSTNTFPSWELAHPYRLIAHNGEINTLRGNINWMRARESQLRSELFGDDLPKALPVIRPGGSDTAAFDNVLELLVLAGRSLPHALMMMIPEAYEGREETPDYLRGFYAFHGCLMEAWDGPAAISFTDGRVIGATLDRNGLRPGRWYETADGWVVLASETGVLQERPENVVRKGRLQPGKLFLVDLAQGRIVPDEELKREIATRRPYAKWVDEQAVHLSDLPAAEDPPPPSESLRTRQLLFGYAQEDMKVILAPLAANAEEAVGSMGNDTPLAVLSRRKPLLYSYFKQLFAQVTNPPIDSIREATVMSVTASVGSERNLLDETPEHARQLVIANPILRDSELEQLRHVRSELFMSWTMDTTWPVADGTDGLEPALERLCAEADVALSAGANILILSDRKAGPERVPIPSLLATSAVHSHLVRAGTRLQAGIVVESGEPRSVHSIATLVGYGAAAVNPYLMLETLGELVELGWLGELTADEAQYRATKGIAKGLLKTMSKMGISTVPSYCGAQIFEAVGLSSELVERHFTGTATRIGGVGLPEIAEGALARHARAFPVGGDQLLPVLGLYAWRRDGEHHSWNPETIASLQHAVRAGSYETFEAYSQAVNADSSRRSTLRGLMQFRYAEGGGIPLDDVEPASEIVKRFSTGAMSLGSISREAHETLARAMNSIGGRSNTGEGGEDPVRFTDDRRSKIKQVASGRFGVNINYLTNADELQIKMAQGAKPGEGGQLPGHKVDRYIASVRLTTPGVGLISPPPHHDIYSIEDLKQLIYDLRCANPEARISVKLVAEVGVGTVAAGRREGGRRPRAHLRPRGRHGRGAAVVDPARRDPVGDRARRDAADAAPQRPALAHLGADRRAAEDGARRRDRRAARRRRDGLRDRAADRERLHDDARLPSEHVPGRHRDAGSGAAQALHRQAGAHRQLPLLRRRGGAHDHGAARHRTLRRPRRPRRPARSRRGGVRVAGARRRPFGNSPLPRGRCRAAATPDAGAGARARGRARLAADRGGAPRDSRRRADRGRVRDREREPHRRRPALARDHARARRPRPARGHDPVHAPRLGRASRSAPGSLPASS